MMSTEDNSDLCDSPGNDQQPEGKEEESPNLDITINNVVCIFRLPLRRALDLHLIGLNGANVEYRKSKGMVTKRLRKPNVTVSIRASGHITCTGATSEDDARTASRRVARSLVRLLERTDQESGERRPPLRKMCGYRVVNVLGTCHMPFAIKVEPFTKQNRELASYEPELHPGVTVRFEDLSATLKVFTTGSVTVTAPGVEAVRKAIERLYPMVEQHGRERTQSDIDAMSLTQRTRCGLSGLGGRARTGSDYKGDELGTEFVDVDDIDGDDGDDLS